MASTSHQPLNPPPTALLVPKPEPNLDPFDNNAPLPPTAFPQFFPAHDYLSQIFRYSFGDNLRQNSAGQSLPDAVPVPDPNSLAIVPVPDPNHQLQLTGVVLTPRGGGGGKVQPRSSELVRVTDLKTDDQRYFRESVRATRMLYDSLRVFAIAAEENRHDPMSLHRRTRGDLKAAAWMRDQGLWMNRDKRIVGYIPGIAIGDLFFFRMELCILGLHGQVQAGIDFVPSSQSSNGEPIATSVIVSGGYEDDYDAGDVIIYSGHGGQDQNGRQIMSQKLESGNLALERSMAYNVEVRVIRGFKTNSGISSKVYIYDGLYRITDTWFDTGKSGFGVFKYKLVRVENQQQMGTSIMKFAENLRKQPLDSLPQGYVRADLSRGKEKFPVLFYNDVDEDHEPLYYDYLVSSVFPPYLYCNRSVGGCNCVGGCWEGCLCAMRNGGEFAYDLNGVLVRGKPVVFECGPHCRCPPSCRNRVTQGGIKTRFEVFRSRETSWGVRALDVIQAGSFICEYAGIVLTREQSQVLTMNGDTLIHPGRFSERWKEWGDVSKVFPDYKLADIPSIPQVNFAMDVSKLRNLACYLSHSSSPNVMVQLVLYDHDNVYFPRIMLFAMENIPPMRELSIDYGLPNCADEEWDVKLAICN